MTTAPDSDWRFEQNFSEASTDLRLRQKELFPWLAGESGSSRLFAAPGLT
jgi:hypothetical protein